MRTAGFVMKPLVALFLVLIAGCASMNDTRRTLSAYTGRTISDFISEKKYYPDSTADLPTGGKVYAFTIGSGSRGRVDDFGNVIVRSNVCRWWMETDSTGVIVRWRYENCS